MESNNLVVKPTIKDYIQAARPKTLPLALATILMGTGVTLTQYSFNENVVFLAILTCFFLQILSNFANDLGDAMNGADNELRVGPERMVNAGKITVPQMKKAVIILSVLSLVSGIGLLYVAFPVLGIKGISILLGVGILSIIAAITYTAGKIPYGYRAMGDLSVLIFFGIVGISGTFYLLTGHFEWNVLLPSFGFGFLATGVLNINNMRDIETDKLANKITIPVLIGRQKAKIYHTFLIVGGLALFCIYAMNIHSFMLYLPIFLGAVFYSPHLMGVLNAEKPVDFIPYLKQLAITNLMFSVLFLGTVSFIVYYHVFS